MNTFHGGLKPWMDLYCHCVCPGSYLKYAVLIYKAKLWQSNRGFPVAIVTYLICIITRWLCSYNARLFNDDVTAIGVSYWQRREFPNYARPHRSRMSDTFPILRQSLGIILKNSKWSDSPETLNSGQNRRCFGRVTSTFDGWPRKTIGQPFYTTPSIVRHFKAIGEFKLKLQSGNIQFGSKSVINCPVWPWNLIDDLEKQ